MDIKTVLAHHLPAQPMEPKASQEKAVGAEASLDPVDSKDILGGLRRGCFGGDGQVPEGGVPKRKCWRRRRRPRHVGRVNDRRAAHRTNVENPGRNGRDVEVHPSGTVEV